MSRLPLRVRIFRAVALIPVAFTGVAYFVGGLATAGEGFMFTGAVAFGVWVMPSILRRGGYEVR